MQGRCAASRSPGPRITAPARVVARRERYFGLARKAISPGPAESRVATPVSGAGTSPTASPPRRATMSASFRVTFGPVPMGHRSASARMTFSVMSMRPLANTASCRMRSNFSCSAIWLMTRVARSCTFASSSLRRMLRSSRISRWRRWKSRLMSARRRSLSRRCDSGIVTLSRSSSVWRSRPSFSTRASSALRAENSRSSACCARLAGAASRNTRSVFTKPIFISAALAASASPPSTAAARILMAAPSEDPAQLELESLDLVPVLALDRRAEREAQRAHRRVPAHREPRAHAQVVRADLLQRAPDVAHVGEEPQAHVLLLVAGHREEDLEVADDAPVAAEDVAVEVARAERGGLETAHRAHAAGVEVLEERQGLAAVAVGVADLAVQQEREPREAFVREEPLALEGRAMVGEVARWDPDLDTDLV